MTPEASGKLSLRCGRRGGLSASLPFVHILDVPGPQMVDQTVEVLKMLGWWKCQVTWWLSGSSSSRPLTFQFPALVVSLAPEVCKVTLPDQSSRPFRRADRRHSSSPLEVLKVFSLILVRQLLPQSRMESCGKGFFSHFPVRKK